ncbi:MAG: hypothetical protein Q9170_002770 [Blastenia crenularia]
MGFLERTRRVVKFFAKQSPLTDYTIPSPAIEGPYELDGRATYLFGHGPASNWNDIASPATPYPRKSLIRQGRGFRPEETQDVYELPGTKVTSELNGTLVDHEDNDGTFNPVKPTEVDATSMDDTASDESCDEISWMENGDVLGHRASINTHMVYKDLELAAEEFRVLSLQPAGKKTDDIHCLLANDDSKTKPVYEALSYTWGDTKERRAIFVNGQPFPVTPNLFMALKNLRRAEGSRILWVDAICIDQDSLSEKTHQVGMMRDIYRDAAQVLMWLGESDQDIHIAMTFLKKRRMFQLLTEDELDPFRPGLAKLFEQPWWSRIWVVQEILVATKPPLLGCGRRWLSWEDLETGVMNLMRQQIPGAGAESYLKNPMAFYDLGFISSALTNGTHDLQATRNSWSTRKQWWSLEDLLTATCNRNTTQPHDKIFSLLGLTLSSVSDEVPIDYDQPVTETYQKAMLHVLRLNMGFLVNAMHRPKAKGIPSWCVDFLTPDWSGYARACGWYRSFGNGSEDSKRRPHLTILHNLSQGTIKVLGNPIGYIDYVHFSKCAPPNLTDVDKSTYSKNYEAEHPNAEQRKFLHRQYNRLVDDIKAFCINVQTSLENQFSTDEVLDLFSSGIRADLYHGELSLYRKEIFSYDYLALEKRAQAEFKKYGDTLAYRRLKLVAAIGRNLIDKTLFSTDSGYLGQAATAFDTIMKGDMVYMIQGCHVPVILRPRQDSASYTIVTFSWIPKLTSDQSLGIIGGLSEQIILC